MQPWCHSLSTNEAHPSKAVEWIRLSNLSYSYYTKKKKKLMRVIANVLRTVIKIYYNTAVGKRGHFARSAVVVGLSKPPIPYIFCMLYLMFALIFLLLITLSFLNSFFFSYL